MTSRKSKKAMLTREERVWAYKHAKEHVIESLKDALTDEHHSMMSAPHTKACNDVMVTGATCVCDAPARASETHALVMKHMERWFKNVRTEKMKDHV